MALESLMDKLARQFEITLTTIGTGEGEVCHGENNGFNLSYVLCPNTRYESVFIKRKSQEGGVFVSYLDPSSSYKLAFGLCLGNGQVDEWKFKQTFSTDRLRAYLNETIRSRLQAVPSNNEKVVVHVPLSEEGVEKIDKNLVLEYL